MKRRKINKKAVALFAALALAFIAYQTWKDLHPVLKIAKGPTDTIEVVYLIDEKSDLKHLPDDRRGVLVDLTKESIPASRFEDRTMDILLSSSTSEPEAKAIISAWENEGNKIIEVFFDLAEEPKDVEAVESLLKNLRAGTSGKYYFSAQLQTKYMDASSKNANAYANFLKYGRVLMFDSATAALPGETSLQTAVRLEKHKQPFMLRVAGAPDIQKLMSGAGSPTYFNGFIIDPPKPEGKR